jgi:hypothetical protein
VPDTRVKRAPLEGTRMVWPAGVEARYGITSVTRWRWERDGKLPKRDVTIGGIARGWRPETLAAAEGEPASRPTKTKARTEGAASLAPQTYRQSLPINQAPREEAARAAIFANSCEVYTPITKASEARATKCPRYAPAR